MKTKIYSLIILDASGSMCSIEKQAVDGVKDLSAEEYQPNCGTPLYDAMGFSITELQGKLEKEDKVLVTDITDGYEMQPVGTSAMFAREKKARTRFFDRLAVANNCVDACM